MTFIQDRLNVSFSQTQGIFNEYAYHPDNGESSNDVIATGYFRQSRFIGDDGWIGGLITAFLSDGYFILRIDNTGITATIVGLGIVNENTDFIPGKTVNNYSALPDPSLYPNYLAICINSQGIWPLSSYKARGEYLSNGVVWSYLGDYQLTEDADQIQVTPSGNITATNVQAALVQLDTIKGAVDTVNSGSGIVVDNTNPANPIINVGKSIVAAVDILAGQPVYADAVTGQLKLGNAGSIATSRIIGLASANVSATFAVTVNFLVMSLTDWTNIVGTTYLLKGQMYYLDLISGKLTTSAPTNTGNVVIQAGSALSNTDLEISISGQILL
jgi:hypothetical protein